MAKGRLQLEKRDPEGDLQVLAFRMVERVLNLTEQRYGIAGLRKDLLPIVHDEVLRHVPHMRLSESVMSLAKKLRLENGANRSNPQNDTAA